MNVRKVKSLMAIMMLLAFVTAISSCSRKMGCPTNLSIGVDNISLIQDISDDDAIE